MNLVFLRGYNIEIISKKDNNLLNNKLFLKRLSDEKNVNLKDKFLNIIENNGIIIGFKKKKELHAAYLFEYDEKYNMLKFKDEIILNEVEDKNKKKFKAAVIDLLKDSMTFEELLNVNKIEWNDIVITPNPNVKKDELTFTTCLIFGLCFGIIFDNILLGILLGIVFGSSYIAIVKNKNKKK